MNMTAFAPEESMHSARPDHEVIIVGAGITHELPAFVGDHYDHGLVV